MIVFRRSIPSEPMKTNRSFLAALAIVIALVSSASAADLAPDIQTRVDAKLKEARAWASDPVVVGAVKAQNENPPAEHAGITQDKWKELSVLDPAVRAFSKNAVAALLKSKKDDSVSEAFVSSSDGTKVAFLAKTSGWSHKGKPKHEVPMTGKTWQGPVEKDESTGLEQVQVSVPVLDGDKPIGSLVVGLSLSKLGQ
jgi:opacity protein-like surface antigen